MGRPHPNSGRGGDRVMTGGGEGMAGFENITLVSDVYEQSRRAICYLYWDIELEA